MVKLFRSLKKIMFKLGNKIKLYKSNLYDYVNEHLSGHAFKDQWPELTLKHQETDKGGFTREYFIITSPLCDSSADNHICIDRMIADQKRTPHDYLFSCWHETSYTESQGKKTEVARIYFNKQGAFVNYTIHKIEEDGIETLIPPSADARSKQEIRAREIFIRFLKPLLEKQKNKKILLQQVCKELELEVCDLQKSFKASNFSDVNQKEKIIDKIHTMLYMTEASRCFYENGIDARIRLINETRDFFEDERYNENAEDNSFEEKDNHNSHEISKNIKIKKEKKKKKLRKISSAKEETIENIDDVIALYSRPLSLEEKIEQLKTHIKEAHPEKTKILFEEINNYLDEQQTKEIFELLFEKIIAEKEEEIAKKLEAIGSFFYERSLEYRQAVLSKSTQEEYSYKNPLGELKCSNILLQLYLSGNVFAFKMFAQQGALIDLRLELTSQHGVAPVTLAAVIVSKTIHSTTENIKFIEILRDCYAINEDPSGYQYSNIDFCKNTLSTEDTTKYMWETIKTNNLFSVAARIISIGQPLSLDLIVILSKNAKVEQLIYNTLLMLANKHVSCTVVLNTYQQGLYFLPFTKKQTININKKIDELTSNTAENVTHKISCIFITASEENDHYIHKISESLLNTIKEKFSALSVENQRQLINNLISCAETMLLDHKVAACDKPVIMVALPLLLNSALENPGKEDYVARIRLLILYAYFFDLYDNIINKLTYTKFAFCVFNDENALIDNDNLLSLSQELSLLIYKNTEIKLIKMFYENATKHQHAGEINKAIKNYTHIRKMMEKKINEIQNATSTEIVPQTIDEILSPFLTVHYTTLGETIKNLEQQISCSSLSNASSSTTFKPGSSANPAPADDSMCRIS